MARCLQRFGCARPDVAETRPPQGEEAGLALTWVPPAGFEPAISTLKGWRPRPLDDGDRSSEYSRAGERDKGRCPFSQDLPSRRRAAARSVHRSLMSRAGWRWAMRPRRGHLRRASHASPQARGARAARGWCACGRSRRTDRTRRTRRGRSGRWGARRRGRGRR